MADGVQAELARRTGVKIEAMVYGDGAFKDPRGKIWELADPVVSPGFTEGLRGVPNELKLKYLADNEFASLSGGGAARGDKKLHPRQGRRPKGPDGQRRHQPRAS